jgi:hypothetical protein
VPKRWYPTATQYRTPEDLDLKCLVIVGHDRSMLPFILYGSTVPVGGVTHLLIIPRHGLVT